MLRIKFGAREWLFDETAPRMMGELVALKEMGVRPDEVGALLKRLATAGGEATTEQRMAVAEAAAQLAYLAAVREDHTLRWREFVWSIPLDDLRAFDVAPAELPASMLRPASFSDDGEEPASAAPAPVAEAFAAAVSPAPKRKSRAKKAAAS